MADSIAKTIFLFFCFFKMDNVKKGCGVGAKKNLALFFNCKTQFIAFYREVVCETTFVFIYIVMHVLAQIFSHTQILIV